MCGPVTWPPGDPWPHWEHPHAAEGDGADQRSALCKGRARWGREGRATDQLPLTTPPTTPFQKELTSCIRKPGASLELSPERLAEAMDSGRVRISGWERMDGWWGMWRGGAGGMGAEFSVLGCSRHLLASGMSLLCNYCYSPGLEQSEINVAAALGDGWNGMDGICGLSGAPRRGPGGWELSEEGVRQLALYQLEESNQYLVIQLEVMIRPAGFWFGHSFICSFISFYFHVLFQSPLPAVSIPNTKTWFSFSVSAASSFSILVRFFSACLLNMAVPKSRS